MRIQREVIEPFQAQSEVNRDVRVSTYDRCGSQRKKDVHAK